MSNLDGFYTPDVNTISVDTANPVANPTIIIHTPFADGGHNGIVCVACADLSSTSGAGTLKIESGFWDGSTFTADATDSLICFIAVLANVTASDWIFKNTNAHNDVNDVGAIRITVTGAASKAHVRTQGKTIEVS